ncbi:ring-cleaving dioxygenase [Rummeliibacillus suwonensis]|uniref:ring-cleaving dioxygenase n=1 Tax=Rummeliibacillus suwonensis TaxID=1306154 RepID=UPI0011B478AF|nr:ring-cleaving dioxygenase [Rummeliibacillus suwonensis]
MKGHHHISMLTKNGKQNNHFYQNILGLKRVKKSVNQDDPSMYHLFYGDEVGSPGLDLTFFEIPIAGKTKRGTNAITQIGLLVRDYDSLLYWQKRFENLNVKHSEITNYMGQHALFFEDHEGLRMVLLNSEVAEVPAWQPVSTSEVPKEHQIFAMGTVEITVRYLNHTVNLLKDLFGFAVVEQGSDFVRLQHMEGLRTGEIVVKELEAPKEKPGRGSIHHLALRVNDQDELMVWNEKLINYGLTTSGIVDRFYFQSIYARDKNGILFELATDGPGFTVDSTVEELGQKLDLPPFLEGQRETIEANLEPLD